MFERLNTPEESYNYKLGAALNMEKTVLKILDSSIEEAQDPQVQQLFREHRNQSEQHVANVEKVFGLFGWQPDESPCPAIDGLQLEAKANAKKANSAIVDPILLEGATEVEHHEIGVYENLISGAHALGRDGAIPLLEENLRSERHALELAKQTHERVAAMTPKQPPREEGLIDKVKNVVS